MVTVTVFSPQASREKERERKLQERSLVILITAVTSKIAFDTPRRPASSIICKLPSDTCRERARIIDTKLHRDTIRSLCMNHDLSADERV